MTAAAAVSWPDRLDPATLAELRDELSVPAEGRDRLDVHQPTTDATVGWVPAGTEEDLEAAVERARAAQPTWAERAPADRRAIVLRLHDLVLDERDRLLDHVWLETGKARRWALEEVLDVALTAGHYADRFESLLTPTRHRGVVPLVMRAVVHREPHGVVGIIAPWNYPLTLAVSDALPALLAGNAVVLKPDEKTPFTALAALRLCREAGLPRDVFQIVTGDGPTMGPALVDRADFVSFTGSVETGRSVAARAGENLIDCSLELGGKNPLLVLADADLDRAVPGALRACFASAGQLCISAERLYVHEAVYEPFVDRFVTGVEALAVGAGPGWEVEMGTLLDAEQHRKVERHVEEAVEAGATLLTGGRALGDLGPHFYAPTVLVDVPPDVAVATEETFGPVVTVEPVASTREAVERANDSSYGLNASVWTRDRRLGRAVGRELEVGSVNVNEAYAAAWGTKDAPMGGTKDSGLGRRHGDEGLLKYTESRTVAEQRHLSHEQTSWLPPERFARLASIGLRWRRRLPRRLR